PDERPPLVDLGLVKRGEGLRRHLLARGEILAQLGETLRDGRIGSMDLAGYVCAPATPDASTSPAAISLVITRSLPGTCRFSPPRAVCPGPAGSGYGVRNPAATAIFPNILIMP